VNFKCTYAADELSEVYSATDVLYALGAFPSLQRALLEMAVGDKLVDHDGDQWERTE
jgi:hypothetical protein